MEYQEYDFAPLPKGLSGYPHQIAGHGLVDIKSACVLHGDDGTIYKQIQPFPKGRTEIEFYRTLFDSDNCDPVLKALRNFVPQWHGLYFDPETEKRYLRLQDILSDLHLPTVADLKIGSKSYAPNAPDAKAAIEKAKYYWREEVGFVITGMKIYNPEKKGYDNFDCFHGRALNPEEVYTHGIRLLVGPSPKRALLLAKSILPQLLAIRSWFESQSSWAFYASSLLIAYDGVPTEASAVDRTVVKWVDFTHMMPTTKRDDNFLHGLNNLIKYFERLIDTEVSAPYIVEPVGCQGEKLNHVKVNHKSS